MRSLLIGISLCFASICSAYSQNENEPATSQIDTPLYFLVDASGSMRGQNQSDAMLLLSALSLPRDQLVSVTFFGSAPTTPGADLCTENFEVPAPRRRGTQFSTDFPDLGGRYDQTAITNAINSLLEKIADPGKIILITDGGEECDENFSGIRDLYPNANIEIRQVGASPNAELQKLESRAPPKQHASPTVPFINFEISTEATEPELSPSERIIRWYEKRLWLFAAVSLLVSAGFWGSSFGRRANEYENATKKLHRKRRELLDKGELTEDQLMKALPPELCGESIRKQGKSDELTSRFALWIFVLLALPLVVFKFDYPEWARCGASLVFGFILFWRLCCVVKNVKPNDHPGFFAWWTRRRFFTVVLGLIGIGLVIWSFWTNLGEVQSATWFILNARFSGTIAVSASAPLLFVGARWWQFEMAKATYQHTYTEAVSESIREIRRKEKLISETWERLKTRHLDWKPKEEFTLIRRVTQFKSSQVMKAREIIIEGLKLVTLTAAGASASQDVNKQLEQFLEAQSVAQRIRSLLDNKSTLEEMEKIVLQDQWHKFADALESKNNNQISQAYLDLSRSIKKELPNGD